LRSQHSLDQSLLLKLTQTSKSLPPTMKTAQALLIARKSQPGMVIIVTMIT
jgi:hypothetical protein